MASLHDLLEFGLKTFPTEQQDELTHKFKIDIHIENLGLCVEDLLMTFTAYVLKRSIIYLPNGSPNCNLKLINPTQATKTLVIICEHNKFTIKDFQTRETVKSVYDVIDATDAKYIQHHILTNANANGLQLQYTRKLELKKLTKPKNLNGMNFVKPFNLEYPIWNTFQVIYV